MAGFRCALHPPYELYENSALVRLEAVEVGSIEDVARVAELAGHGRDAFLAHVVELVGGKRAEDAFDTLARATAPSLQRVGVVDSHPLLVEQAIQQAVRRQ